MQMIVAVELRQWSGVEAYIYSCIIGTYMHNFESRYSTYESTFFLYYVYI